MSIKRMGIPADLDVINEKLHPPSSFEAIASETTTQHAAIADALASISSLWDLTVVDGGIGTQHGASYHDNQIVVHSIATDYYQPYSSVFCAPTRALSIVNASISGVPAVEAPSIRRAQLLELPGIESDNRVKWVQLPQSPLTGVSVGFVVLLPRNPSDLSKRVTTTIQNNTDIVVCSIAAGWGASSINITSFQHSNSPTSSLVKFDISSVTLNDSTPNLNLFQTRSNLPVFFSQPRFPSIPIEIDVDWAEFLNPYVPSANTTVIDFLLKYSAKNGSKAGVPEVATRNIISGLMANGLARSGFTSELQGNIKLIKENEDTAKFGGMGNGSLGEVPDGNLWVSGKSDLFTVDPEESKNWVKLRVDSTMQGYAYNIEGPAPKIAIAFLLTYCCFALSHCFYSGISGISSTCWDSISEVTALAINSSPTTILRNTCAGIAEIRIFRTPVRILTRSDEEGEGEHLELVFGEIDHEDSQKRAIKPNRKYGTMSTAKGDARPAKKGYRPRKGRHPRKRKKSQA
ncbi:hypothetical protein MMC22_009127 [Lobaria immixta]|nr:hypothetical protein [Lobaria immixta]